MDLMDGRLCKRGRIIQTGVSSGKEKSKRNTPKETKWEINPEKSGSMKKELEIKKEMG